MGCYNIHLFVPEAPIFELGGATIENFHGGVEMIPDKGQITERLRPLFLTRMSFLQGKSQEDQGPLEAFVRETRG